MNGVIVYNAIRTPDGTILESKSRHDYREYTDSSNGKIYMVDGGLDYLRRNVNIPFIELTRYECEDFLKLRDIVSWGTYGKEGDQPLKFVPISKLDDEHLNTLADLGYIYPQLRRLISKEVEYRDELSRV